MFDFFSPLFTVSMFAYFELIIECSPLLVTDVKTKFVSIYRCCSSMYDIFIKYIVFYYEIKIKILPRHECMYIDKSTIYLSNGKQCCEKTLDGMQTNQKSLVRNKIKQRKKYKIGKSPTSLDNISIVL